MHTREVDEDNSLSDPIAVDDGSNHHRIVSWKAPEKLKVKGRSFPEVNSKFCDQVIKKIMHDIKEINLSGKKMEKFIFC